jgi:DNA replication and repair protein RecF
MGNLQNIGLVQFKNHREKKLVFNKRITGITGNNGTGKTNILDAIYYISASRSYFNKSDKVLQFFNQSGFRIDANFINGDGPFPVTCIFREDGKKELYIGKELIRKASDFIGHVQCVMIAPDDVSFINEGSEIRRKFMDTLFCLTSKTYLQNLQQYNKTLQQRNAFLKEWFETGERDATLMGIYN